MRCSNNTLRRKAAWWNNVCKPNPELNLSSGDSTVVVRMDAMNSENMKAYFDLVMCMMNLTLEIVPNPFTTWMRQASL